MLKNYFITAWRNLWRNKSIAVINLFGLSVGITAAVLILLWVQNERNFDTYHPDADNIYRIVNHIKVSKDEEWVWESSPLELATASKAEIPEIIQATRINVADWSETVFAVNNKLFSEKNCGYVDSNWFDMFHYDLKQGSIQAFVQDPFSVILTASKAAKFFGDVNAVGQTIRMDSVNYTVKAVVKDNPANSSFQCGIMFPFSVFVAHEKKNGNEINWNNYNNVTFIKIKSTARLSDVVKKINKVLAKNKGKDSDGSITLHTLASMHFDNHLQSSVFSHAEKKTTYIFSILALLLLLTACINYVNLTTAKASLRAKEVSIRKIVGAYSFHLFFQFIAESVLISIISLAISIVLIQFSIPFFNQLTDREFTSPFISIITWKVLMGTLFATIILNGVYPALMLSSFKPLNVFRGRNILKVKDSGLRKGLVVFQFTISVMLIVGTIVVFKQMQFIQNTNPGYNRSQIISIQVPFKEAMNYAQKNGRDKSLVSLMKQELINQANTQLVTAANQPIVNIQNRQSGSSKWDGKDSLYNPTLVTLSVDENYKDIFELQMKEGRWYFPGSKDDAKNYILNETAVKQLNIHQPVIGQRFSQNGVAGIIIGIVKDFHHGSMHSKIEPVLIYNNNWKPYLFVKAKEGNVKQTLASIQTVWHQFLPDEPFDYTFLDDSFNSLYRSDLKISKLILVFSIITIIISALGLFGLAAFMAERKTKEIGIRKILGATIVSITALLSKEFIGLVIIAIIIASPIAWWSMNKWLEDFAYRINISWWMFLLAGLTALLVALLTVSYQAIKAAIANPVKSLKTE
jgi:ABC-type antimicrobial peptide transport system permease subunit